MNNGQFSEPWVTVKTLELLRYDFHTHRAVPNDLLDDVIHRAQIQQRKDWVKHEMEYEMRSFLLGRTLTGFVVQRPANWFEAWKENAYRRGYLGPWARRLWPVRFDREELKATEVYPRVAPEQCGPRVLMRYTENPWEVGRHQSP
jgi:hypothetical protein